MSYALEEGHESGPMQTEDTQFGSAAASNEAAWRRPTIGPTEGTLHPISIREILQNT
jgi:hypothetical protein